MTSFYNNEDIRSLRARERGFRLAGFAVLLAGLVICVLLCTRVRPANSLHMLHLTAGCSTVSMWLGVTLLRDGRRPLRAEKEHVALILRAQENGEGEPAVYEGVLTGPVRHVRLPNGLKLCRIDLLRGPEGMKALSVPARRMKQLPPEGSRVRVTTVFGYVTTVEVTDDARA